jgi:acetylornithine/N-succinyldiaminopimelate aminotransferase
MSATPSTNRPAGIGPGADRARELLRSAGEVIAPTYKRPDQLFVRGEGCWLEDADGRRYLDMASGIAVNALGHGAAEVAEALREGAEGLVHVSNLYHTAPAIELAEELVARSFARQVFFANSGAEANEGAIKFARLWAGEGQREIVYFDGSFHGRTLATLAATDRPDYRDPFGPAPAGFRKAPWNEEPGLKAIGESTAAAIIEPIQGESGIRVPDPGFLAAVRRRCDDVGALLIFDEVQAGLGRTGRLWAHEHDGVEPDLMTLAKPLAGGLPMGAVLIGAKPAATVRAGAHATTFGGGPLVASVALRVLRTLADPAFLDQVSDKGRVLRERLASSGAPGIREIRGRGLFVGVQLREPSKVREHAHREGLLVVPAGDDVLRLLPPLNVAPGDLEEAAARLERALHRAAQAGDA